MRNLRPAFTQAVYGTRMDSYRLYWDQKCLRRRKKKKCQINRNIIDNLQTLSLCTSWTIKSTVALQVVVLLFRADLLLTMKISPVSAMQTYHNYIQGCFEILDVLLNITCVIMYFTIGSLDVNMSNFTSEDQQRTPCCKTILCLDIKSRWTPVFLSWCFQELFGPSRYWHKSPICVQRINIIITVLSFYARALHILTSTVVGPCTLDES